MATQIDIAQKFANDRLKSKDTNGAIEKRGYGMNPPSFSPSAKIPKASIVEIEPNEIGSFSIKTCKPDGGQAFQIRKDENYQTLKEKIKDCGVLEPAIVRRWTYDDNYKYEMIAGHRRLSICKELNIKIPCIVKELSDDDAVIAMAVSNTHRDEYRLSEKAWSLRMELDAKQHQGKKLVDADGNSTPQNTNAEIAKDNDMSTRTVTRMIRLTYLNPTILSEYVDSKVLSFIPAVHISYLTEEHQKIVLDCLQHGAKKISMNQSQYLLGKAKDKSLTKDDIINTLMPESNTIAKVATISFKSDRVAAYLRGKKKKEIEQEIFDTLQLRNEFFPDATVDEIRTELRQMRSSYEMRTANNDT